LAGRYPYVWVDALYEKVREDSAVTNHAVVVAIGVNELGHREILGVMIMPTEDTESWKMFLRSLVERGLTGVKLIISDKHLGIREAVKQIFNNGVLWQRCKVHTMRNILCRVSKSAKQEVANALKTIFAQASRPKAEAEARRVIDEFGERFPEAMRALEDSLDEVLTFYRFPQEHWKKISSTNPLERLNRETRRRTRVVGVFPAVNSCLRLVGMILLEQHEEWLTQTYMDQEKLRDLYAEDDIATAMLPPADSAGRSTADINFLPVFNREKELVLV
jgi:transposase-like protein